MRERIMGMLAHVTVSETDMRVSDWQKVQKELLDFPHVKAVSPFIEKPAMLNQGDEARAAVLQGILPDQERQVSTVFEHVVKGDMQKLQPGSFNIAIGATMAKELKVDVGDALTLVSPSENALETGEMPALQRFTIAAIFRVDMQQFDSTSAYVNLEDAAKTFAMGSGCDGFAHDAG